MMMSPVDYDLMAQVCDFRVNCCHRRDPELAEMLQKLWMSAFETLGVAAEHYLMPKTPKDNVRHLMTLTQWMLRGMAMDKHLVFNDSIIEYYLRLWCRLLTSHLCAKPNVNTPPTNYTTSTAPNTSAKITS